MLGVVDCRTVVAVVQNAGQGAEKYEGVLLSASTVHRSGADGARPDVGEAGTQLRGEGAGLGVGSGGPEGPEARQ